VQESIFDTVLERLKRAYAKVVWRKKKKKRKESVQNFVHQVTVGDPLAGALMGPLHREVQVKQYLQGIEKVIFPCLERK
jgi:hypothetical protein